MSTTSGDEDETETAFHTLEITEHQKDLIKQSWECKASELSERGVDIFVRFFEEHPIYKSYFKQFRNTDIEDLRESPKLRAHSGLVMHGICEMVEKLEDPEGLRDWTIDIIARPHYIRGVRPSQYRELFTIILDFLKSKLGERLDRDTEEAWILLFDHLHTNIEIVMDEAFETDQASRK